MGKSESYEYTWTGPYPAVIDGHSTPEGAGVMAIPGETFRTVAPLNTEGVPFAVVTAPTKPDPAKTTKTDPTAPEADTSAPAS